AVMNNLCWINRRDGGGGSAVMIDEGGTYLTAAHIFDTRTTASEDISPTDSPTTICHLASGEVVPVSSYLMDGEHDIALCNAVRANAPHPLSGLAFNATPPQLGERAWMQAVRAARPPLRCRLSGARSWRARSPAKSRLRRSQDTRIA